MKAQCTTGQRSLGSRIHPQLQQFAAYYNINGDVSKRPVVCSFQFGSLSMAGSCERRSRAVHCVVDRGGHGGFHHGLSALKIHSSQAAGRVSSDIFVVAAPLDTTSSAIQDRLLWRVAVRHGVAHVGSRGIHVASGRPIGWRPVIAHDVVEAAGGLDSRRSAVTRMLVVRLRLSGRSWGGSTRRGRVTGRSGHVRSNVALVCQRADSRSGVVVRGPVSVICTAVMRVLRVVLVIPRVFLSRLVRSVLRGQDAVLRVVRFRRSTSDGVTVRRRAHVILPVGARLAVHAIMRPVGIGLVGRWLRRRCAIHLSLGVISLAIGAIRLHTMEGCRWRRGCCEGKQISIFRQRVFGSTVGYMLTLLTIHARSLPVETL